MTRQELDAALARIGLPVPEDERDAIAAAARYLNEMQALLRPKREVGDEPAHTVSFPEG